jgi:hypothetical protein
MAEVIRMRRRREVAERRCWRWEVVWESGRSVRWRSPGTRRGGFACGSSKLWDKRARWRLLPRSSDDVVVSRPFPLSRRGRSCSSTWMDRRAVSCSGPGSAGKKTVSEYLGSNKLASP